VLSPKKKAQTGERVSALGEGVQMSAAGAFALALGVALAVGMILGFSVQSQQINPVLPLIQSGAFTWDLYAGGAVLDSLMVNYRLYQAPFYYLLQLDPLARPLFVSPGSPSIITVQTSVQVRMHQFLPRVIPLDTMGWWEYIIPLAQPNAAAIVMGGGPSCNLVAWSGGGALGRNALGFAIEGSYPNNTGYMQFYMQNMNGEAQDWSNYTFWTTGPLALTLMSV
jgi:hypothetical protein